LKHILQRDERLIAHHIDKISSPPIDELLGEATRLLVEAAHPEKIILFGSYARGDFDEGSDLDLLIILPTVVDRFEEMVQLRLVLRDIPMPIDVIVYSRSDVEERQHLRGTMLYRALREGRILHDAA
jgi:predicted nucleotidyltransferase